MLPILTGISQPGWTHPSPALGLGCRDQEQPHGAGTGEAPRLWQRPEELEKPSLSTGFLCQDSRAEAALRPSHLTSMSQNVLHKNILGEGRERGGIPDTDLRQQTNPTFLSPCFRKEGERSSSTGWDQAGTQHVELWAVTSFIPKAGKKMLVCTSMGLGIYP